MDNTTSWAQVVDYLMDEITNRNLNPGDKLPPERTMAADLNISRAIVREAIKVMNYLGFIDSTQGSGNFIAERYSETVANIMRVMYLRGIFPLKDSRSFGRCWKSILLIWIIVFTLCWQNAIIDALIEGNIDKGHQAIRSHFSHLDRA
jgi:DNA-binding FadR family transcriptional regulator